MFWSLETGRGKYHEVDPPLVRRSLGTVAEAEGAGSIVFRVTTSILFGIEGSAGLIFF